MVRCDVCGVGEASYVCRRCGARTCSECFDAASWLCSRCYSLAQRASPVAPKMGLKASSRLPTLMLAAGLSLIAAGILIFLLLPLMAAGGSVGTGGIIFIGPLPIAFAAGAWWPLIVAAIIFIALLLIALITFKPLLG